MDTKLDRALSTKADAAATDDLGAGNIDKVRDILFGGQMRDYERRFARLEERLLQETTEMKDDVRKRLSALEQFLRQEVESLADRIRTEHDERTDADKDLASEARDAAKALEKKAGALDDHLGRVQRDLRQQLLELHQRMSDELRQKTDEVLARFMQEATELRTDKTDRATLASLLTEMAMRLNNELQIPASTMVDEGDRDTGRDAGGASDRHDDITSLRALIVGPEQRRLAALQARMDDREGRAADLAEVLPRVLLQHAQDPHFTTALTPPIEKAITTSVQRNPKPLADALFPVMGPAIRKAVSAGLASMVESINRTLEQAVSWRSLRWRLEAMRTGKSFAEIVVAKTLLYRVEQVFLIDRRSGLLLQHAWAESALVQDGDMVSGMLTAIRDFVQDSFKVASSDSLEALKVGDLSVWIEPGPTRLSRP